MLNIDALRSEFLGKLSSVKSLEELKKLKSEYTSVINNLLKTLKDLPPEDRPRAGSQINQLKTFVLESIDSLESEFKKESLEKQLQSNWQDMTLVLDSPIGALHPITLVKRKILNYFRQIGFSVWSGPLLEREDYNFDLLNVPKDHPARDMQDTFYVNIQGYLLRTHTSCVQIRALLSSPLPIYLVSAGRVFRRDDDPTHSPMFHQIEGLVVDKNLSFGQMRAVIEGFLKHFFEEDVNLRFRASYFPFTEPSAEVDISCIFCRGSGCSVCKNSGWLEVMGCGMVHPAVLRNCSIDPEVYNGFAFGAGLERLAMLLYRIENIKTFFENDIRFLKQFNV
ncbi:MAG: phenylalanine--tRNA ligase subunit alpha [Aquificaceae bacterium]|nr:phenylalanine--tRNA ligase subunit alpha [Aquificaceae bacterium]MDW8236887.1 phenylalanine--tRNA ligase subunit alpha [Aquificaceae bacterium]